MGSPRIPYLFIFPNEIRWLIVLNVFERSTKKYHMLFFHHQLLILNSSGFLEWYIQWNIPFENQTES